MSDKQAVLALSSFFLAAFFLASASAVSTTCGLINVDYNNNLTLTTGENGGFTISAFNQGTTTQRISASAQCNPLELSCSFSGIGDNTLLAPGEQKSFSLNVEATSVSGNFAIPAEFRAGPSSATCTSALQFNANVLPKESQTVQPVAAWITPSETQNARPSDAVVFTIGLKNNLNKKIYAGITSRSTNPFESSTSLSASNVALQAGETKYVTVTVRLPPGTPGGTYNWIYHVDAGNCCNYNLDLPVSITAEAPRLSLQLLNAPAQDQCTTADIGNTTSISLSLQNNGETTGPFDLAIEGSNNVKSIATVTEPRLTLLNGEQKPFQIQISPTTRTPIDNYTYTLVGTYQGFMFLDRTFCFKVQGASSVAVDSQSNIVIERMRISNTLLNVTNTGTLQDQYALSIPPEAGLTFQLQPSSFSLNAGQTQVVALAITSDLSAPLGEKTLKLRVDTPRYSKNVDLNATIYATGKTGESLLKVTSSAELRLTKGIAKAFNITVENLGATALRDVELIFDGIPNSWYVAETRTILPGGSEVFRTVVTIPTSAAQTQFEVNLTARSGNEFVAIPVTFSVSNVAFDFTINELVENRNSAGETTSVDLITTLSNNGASTVTQATPVITDLNYIYSQTPQTVTLEAGQSVQVRIHLDPARSDTANKSIPIQFSALEGTTNPRQVAIPALKVAGPNITLKIAAILILLIAIVAVLAKTQNKI